MIAEDTVILVVDDSESMRTALKEMLESLGFIRVLLAEDGDVALKMVNDLAPTKQAVQMIIADWVMPNMAGIDLLKIIRSSENKQVKNLPFMIVTTNNQLNDVLDAVQHGVDNYLVKPVTDSAFVYEKMEAAWAKRHGKK